MTPRVRSIDRTDCPPRVQYQLLHTGVVNISTEHGNSKLQAVADLLNCEINKCTLPIHKESVLKVKFVYCAHPLSYLGYSTHEEI